MSLLIQEGACALDARGFRTVTGRNLSVSKNARMSDRFLEPVFRSDRSCSRRSALTGDTRDRSIQRSTIRVPHHITNITAANGSSMPSSEFICPPRSNAREERCEIVRQRKGAQVRNPRACVRGRVQWRQPPQETKRSEADRAIGDRRGCCTLQCTASGGAWRTHRGRIEARRQPQSPPVCCARGHRARGRMLLGPKPAMAGG